MKVLMPGIEPLM